MGCLLLWAGIVLWMPPANERRHYNVTWSLIGWAHSQNYPCMRSKYTLPSTFIQSFAMAYHTRLNYKVNQQYINPKKYDIMKEINISPFKIRLNSNNSCHWRLKKKKSWPLLFLFKQMRLRSVIKEHQQCPALAPCWTMDQLTVPSTHHPSLEANAMATILMRRLLLRQHNSFNPCLAEYILRDTKVHLNFFSFLSTEIAQVAVILRYGRHWAVNSAYMMTSSNGSIFCLMALCDWWIPLIKASDRELWCILWSAPEQMFEQATETWVIWEAIMLIMTLL